MEQSLVKWDNVDTGIQPKGIMFLTFLRFRLSHLREYKFKHNFQDPFNLVWNYGFNIHASFAIAPCTLIRDTLQSTTKILNVDYWIILSS